MNKVNLILTVLLVDTVPQKKPQDNSDMDVETTVLLETGSNVQNGKKEAPRNLRSIPGKNISKIFKYN
jgi:hypothetical protein